MKIRARLLGKHPTGSMKVAGLALTHSWQEFEVTPDQKLAFELPQYSQYLCVEEEAIIQRAKKKPIATE